MLRPTFALAAKTEENDSGPEFQEKLKEMLKRTEKSAKLLREQIVSSQTAPYLPELYMQLADLLSQRSNTLYYIQMEKLKKEDSNVAVDKKFSPVIQAQKEAIEVYQQVLHDFPNFSKREITLFRLALALKSIDETPDFIRTSSQLISQFPNSTEAMKVRLLLGQHYFDNQDFSEAKSFLTPITKTTYNYERNLARYKLGLVAIAEDRYPDALHLFEEVINDPELKEQDNPYNLSLKDRTVKTDLKREALINSIRAYTKVFEKDPHPVEYYSKLAPTEVLFQEVAEKLSVRYINLKKYDYAILLLRTMSERTVDPQKIINIYHEVLLMTPIRERIAVPFEEMRFLLEKYNLWISFFDLKSKARAESFNFLEKQIRDLGTTAHELAKLEKLDAAKKRLYLTRARDFYLLYVSFFDKTPGTVKLATNLADVYFLLGDYMRAGDYYLRVYAGTYGVSPDRKLLIENAVFCLQKKADYDFYENVRMRGLLIKAIEFYMKFSPVYRNDAKLGFASLKAEYEQGFFPEILEKLYAFSGKHRKDPKAVDAAELILDYYNTRNEFGGLEANANRLLLLHLPDVAFNKKVTRIRYQAKNKIVQEKIKSVAGYDEFAQGKSYLSVAISSTNSAIANEALQQALVRSKAERDIKTFLQVAALMGDKEKDPVKRSAIVRSVATEYEKMGRFYEASSTLDKILAGQGYAGGARVTALEDSLNLALILRDWKLLERNMRDPQMASIAPAVRARVHEQVTDLLDAPIPISPSLASTLIRADANEETLLALYKAQFKLDSTSRERVLRMVRNHCGGIGKQPVCRWSNLEKTEAQIAAFQAYLRSAPSGLPGIEQTAQHYAAIVAEFQKLEGGPDRNYEAAASLKNYEINALFAQYLTAQGNGNATLKPVLDQKAAEVNATAKLYLDRCQALGTPFCAQRKAPPLNELLGSKRLVNVSANSSDPSNSQINDLQKSIFAGKDEADSYLTLSGVYLDQGYVRQAAAAATLGIVRFPNRQDEFKTILGCSVLKLGLYGEAKFHLKSAGGSADGRKERCEAELRAAGGAG